ncbi:MAG: aldehyde dehydrogenase (NADP(+)) [Chitinophagaceae bacterium]|nr:MAG: aldehyde dehydrogenase (NADP(+)) [Chitinophagaceae bacterium]
MTTEKNIIGSEFSGNSTSTFNSYNPATGTDNEYRFHHATEEEVNQAADKAAAAAISYFSKSGAEKATFLETIADGILALGSHLIEVCTSETGLPAARIEGERGRTVAQLRMFASLLREGSWVDARIERAVPDRLPLPKADLRMMQVAIGPVLVFGASNFPLAFSVAGGDTASALAAGCPVIVKAHGAHPATSSIIGKVIQGAAAKCDMPDGVFSLVFGEGSVTGMQLVKHPSIRAVGFTGSFRAGKAIFDAAAQRPHPIPVYAEMGSTNPVFILPGAMKDRGEAIAAAYAASVTLGVGQFCTNPGLLFYRKEGDTAFPDLLKDAFGKTSGGVMLAPGIAKSYRDGVASHLHLEGVQLLAEGNAPADSGSNTGTPALITTTAENLARYPALADEVFGPASVVVPVHSKEEMLAVARNLEGHLTCTIHGNENELPEYSELLLILQQKAGRVVINNFPTGVEVCSAMVHGGPFPATTDSRSTSVGTAAIFRFTRPVCFQNVPENMLPDELKNTNPLHIYRLDDNVRTNSSVI